MATKVGEAYISIDADERPFDKATKSVKKNVNGLKSSFKSLGTVIKGVLAFATIKSFFSLADSIDTLAKRARALKVTVDELRALSFEAKKAGINIDQFQVALGQMTSKIGQAAQGSGRAKAVLEQFGVSIQDLAKEGPVAQLQVIAQLISSIRDRSEQAAVASKLFGESLGVQMLPFLIQSADKFEKMTKAYTDMYGKAPDTGIIEEMLDTFAGIQEQLKLVGMTLMSEIAPAIKNVASVVSSISASFGGATGWILKMATYSALLTVSAYGLQKAWTLAFKPIKAIGKKMLGLVALGKTIRTTGAIAQLPNLVKSVFSEKTSATNYLVFKSVEPHLTKKTASALAEAAGIPRAQKSVRELTKTLTSSKFKLKSFSEGIRISLKKTFSKAVGYVKNFSSKAISSLKTVGSAIGGLFSVIKKGLAAINITGALGSLLAGGAIVAGIALAVYGIYKAYTATKAWMTEINNTRGAYDELNNTLENTYWLLKNIYTDIRKFEDVNADTKFFDIADSAKVAAKEGLEVYKRLLQIKDLDFSVDANRALLEKMKRQLNLAAPGSQLGSNVSVGQDNKMQIGGDIKGSLKGIAIKSEEAQLKALWVTLDKTQQKLIDLYVELDRAPTPASREAIGDKIMRQKNIKTAVIFQIAAQKTSIRTAGGKSVEELVGGTSKTTDKDTLAKVAALQDEIIKIKLSNLNDVQEKERKLLDYNHQIEIRNASSNRTSVAEMHAIKMRQSAELQALNIRHAETLRQRVLAANELAMRRAIDILGYARAQVGIEEMILQQQRELEILKARGNAETIAHLNRLYELQRGALDRRRAGTVAGREEAIDAEEYSDQTSENRGLNLLLQERVAMRKASNEEERRHVEEIFKIKWGNLDKVMRREERGREYTLADLRLQIRYHGKDNELKAAQMALQRRQALENAKSNKERISIGKEYALRKKLDKLTQQKIGTESRVMQTSKLSGLIGFGSKADPVAKNTAELVGQTRKSNSLLERIIKNGNPIAVG